MDIAKHFIEIHTDYFVCDRRRTVSLQEKGKRYEAINVDSKQIAQYHTDDPDRKTESKRCDYAIYIFEKDQNGKIKADDRLIFIELKGSDVDRAIEQINSSLEERVINGRVNISKVDALVITSKTPSPKYHSSKKVALRNKLNQYGKGCFIVKTRTFSENV